MPIIPVPEKLNWNNPPVITIILILINVFVYFTAQLNDDFHERSSFDYYITSGLADIEIPLYVKYLEDHGKKTDIDFKKIDEIKPEERNIKLLNLHIRSLRDHDFLRELKHGLIIEKDSVLYKKWLNLKTKYIEQKDKIISYKYGLIPAKPNVIDFITYMFLHGSFSHLLGNMVFLWLIGVMLEQVISRKSYVFLYLLTGIAAGLFFMFLSLKSMLPLVGASGAIAGLMGLYSVIFMKKKVKVFLYLGFYFDYLRLPALILLPLWIIKEAFFLISEPGSGVAYSAHLGGLISGSFAGYILLTYFIKDSQVSQAIPEEEDSRVNDLISKADESMKELEFDDARVYLNQALSIEPENLDVVESLYKIEKNFTDEEGFKIASKKIILLLCKKNKESKKAIDAFNLYIKTGSPKFSPQEFLNISIFFMTWGHIEATEKILNLLIKKCPKLQGLSSAIFKFANVCESKGEVEMKMKYFQILKKYFKGSPEAESINRLKA